MHTKHADMAKRLSSFLHQKIRTVPLSVLLFDHVFNVMSFCPALGEEVTSQSGALECCGGRGKLLLAYGGFITFSVVMVYMSFVETGATESGVLYSVYCMFWCNMCA